MAKEHHESVLINLPLGIRFYESNVDSFGYVPFHWHSSLEILYVLSGKLKLTVDGKEYTIGHNEFIAISSGQIHDVANTPNHAMVLQVPLVVINKFERSPESLNFDVKKNRNPGAYNEIIEMFQELNTALQSKSAGYLYDIEIALMQILKRLVLFFTLPEPLKISFQTSLKDIIIYINEHYKEKITIEQLASIGGYNKNYLSRLFKNITGTTLINYIYQVRLSHFYTAVLHTDTDIHDLMDEYGLKNQRTSRELFKKIYGMLPQEARHIFLSHRHT